MKSASNLLICINNINSLFDFGLCIGNCYSKAFSEANKVEEHMLAQCLTIKINKL